MKIYAFSADLKLDASGQGYKILEINDLMRSGLEGYQHVTNQNMIEDILLPDYETLFPDHAVCTSLHPENIQSEKPVIFMPRGNRTITRYSRSELVLQAHMPYTTVNSDLRFMNFCESKAYQSEVFSSDAGLKNIYPETRLVTVYPGDVKNEYEGWIEDLSGQVVLKANSDCGGNGIFILKKEKIKARLSEILGNYSGKKEPVWCGIGDYVGVIQDLLPPNLVEIDGENYDATMRVVVTVWQKDAQSPFEAHIHDAYWKPCAAPYEGLDDRLSRISYSAAYREQPIKKTPFQIASETLKSDFVQAVVFGRMIEPVKTRYAVEGREVSDEIKSWLFPALTHSMPVLINSAVSRPVSDRVIEWLASDSKPKRMLGLFTSMDYNFYPENYYEGSDDILSMEYPPAIVEALTKYIAGHYETDALAIKILATHLSKPNPLSCENIDRNVRRPILEAISKAQNPIPFSPFLTSILFTMALK